MRSRLLDRLLPAGRRLSTKAAVESCHRDTLGTTHERCLGYTLNDEPQPQVDLAFGFLMVKPPPVTLSTKSTSAPFR